MPSQICALCLREAKLCKSHILPDFAYKEVIDYTFHPRMVVVRDLPRGRISDKTQQTGFWERLLCEKCESRFSKYEKYASEYLLTVKLSPPRSTTDRVITLQGLDYAPLKLFLLSVLWRVGVAKSDFFRCVKLGPHEQRLREILDDEKPCDPGEYGCLITPLLPEQEIDVNQLIFQPLNTRTEGHNGCLLVFYGFAFQFFISRHALRPGVAHSFLNREGRLVMVWSRIGDFQPLRNLWSRTVQAIHREV